MSLPSGNDRFAKDFVRQEADVLRGNLAYESALVHLNQAVCIKYDLIHSATSLGLRRIEVKPSLAIQDLRASSQCDLLSSGKSIHAARCGLALRNESVCKTEMPFFLARLEYAWLLHSLLNVLNEDQIPARLSWLRQRYQQATLQ